MLYNIDTKRIVRLVLEEFASGSMPSVHSINSAIDGHSKVVITYDGEGKDKYKGPRLIDVYAYGITKGGNQAVRAFQEYPQARNTLKGWKLFRLDRLGSWKVTGQVFTKPESFGGYGEFNPNGDRLMPTVYKIARFDSGVGDDTFGKVGPKKIVTPTETGMSKLLNAVRNPIYLKDLKKNSGLDSLKRTPETNGPKTVQNITHNISNAKSKLATVYGVQPTLKQTDDYGNANRMSGENDFDRLSDKYFSDYEKKERRSQADRDRRVFGTSKGYGENDDSGRTGSVDRMKKYHKGSANDILSRISREELDKAMEELQNKENS